MQNQNDDDSDFSDEVYDETLDENFEEEFEGDDEYLDEEDLAAYDEFEEESGEWDDSEGVDEDFEDDGLGAGVSKKKRLNIGMSFNAMMITGAVILGVGVLAFQVVTKKPIISLDAFTSALRMSGASDGPVFGDETNTPDTALAEDTDEEKTKGFLYDPEILNSMEVELEGTPPMPSPIVAEDKQGNNLGDIVDTSLTPLPIESEEGGADQVPRPPEDAPVIDRGLADLINKKEPEKAETKNSSAAEEFLKTAVEEHTEKQQPVEKISTEKPKKKQPIEDKVVEKVETKPIKPTKEIAQVEVKHLKTIQPSGETEKKLNLILERLDDMELQITQIRETGNSKIENISDNLSLLKREMGSMSAKPAPAKKAVLSVPKKTVVKKLVVRKVKSQPKKRKASIKISWELRAAQPGKAWVSQKGQQDMRPVVIGDSLSGIGRITAISYSGNRWVVQGTLGRILQ